VSSHPHNRYHRRSIRLCGYYYSQADAYFVTVCVHGHACTLGQVVDSRVELSDGGQIAFACWDDLPNHYPHVELDAFAIVPNHVHGIVVLLGEDRVTAAAVVGAGLGADTVQNAVSTTETRPGATCNRHGLPEIAGIQDVFGAAHQRAALDAVDAVLAAQLLGTRDPR
jgi:hypothetical protein